MKLIKQTATVWAIFDEETNVIVGEDLQDYEVVEIIVDLQRPAILAQVQKSKSEMPWHEVQLLAGRFSCCECHKTLDSWNEKWPLERQRCKACLSQ